METSEVQVEEPLEVEKVGKEAVRVDVEDVLRGGHLLLRYFALETPREQTPAGAS